LGNRSQLTFYAGVIEGSYLVADLSRDAYGRVAELNRQFPDLNLGFVDAAIVAIAEALGLSRVATTDRRHFAPLAAALSIEILP
jgi:predicted nucleic acid-binding protein